MNPPFRLSRTSGLYYSDSMKMESKEIGVAGVGDRWMLCQVNWGWHITTIHPAVQSYGIQDRIDRSPQRVAIHSQAFTLLLLS